MTDNPTPSRSDLHEAVGATLAAMDLPQIVQALRAEVQNMRRVLDCQIQVLKAFGDLFMELTDKTADRRFLEKSILKAEREAARTRVPLWFWRPEPELDLKGQLVRRARYLHDERYSLDDSWDLLREYLSEWAKPDEEISDDRLSRLLGHIYKTEAA